MGILINHENISRSANADHLLACPSCSGELARNGRALACSTCGETYRHGEAAGQWDLRLRKSKSFTMTYDPMAAIDPTSDRFVGEIATAAERAITDLRDGKLDDDLFTRNRLNRDLLKHFPGATGADQWMLDIGCGHRQFASDLTSLTRFNYVGVDYDGPDPDLLADAHALPFRDASFDFIISIAVLEHLSHPDIAMAEAFRVLKPGGTFIGTVAFLEPFHMDSHYHMTHLGTHRALSQAGFEVVAIAPNKQWTGLCALAEMVLFPGLGTPLQRAMVAPAAAASALLAGAKRTLRRRQRPARDEQVFGSTAGFRFVARRASA